MTARNFVQKHRGGAQGTCKMKWEGELTKFSNLEGDNFSSFVHTEDFFDEGETIGSKMNLDIPPPSFESEAPF